MSDRPATEMEMRVAKAICGASCAVGCKCWDFESFEETARAAIQAMREPTEDMLHEAAFDVNSSLCKYVYQAMINTASPPGDKEHG